jgi:hypothetical protein
MQTRRRPSTGWYWLSGLIALAGLAGAILWGLTAYLQMSDQAAGFPRMAVPGLATVDVSEPGNLTIYYEAPRIAGEETAPPLAFRVTDPAGNRISTRPFDRDLRFDIRDRVAIAVATFEAQRPGEYAVSVRGAAPGSASVSVGRALGFTAAANFVGAVFLVTLTSLLAIAIAAVVAVRRSQAPAPAQVPTPPRQPVGVS